MPILDLDCALHKSSQDAMKFLYLFGGAVALPSKVEHSSSSSLQNPDLSCEEQIAQMDLRTRITHSEIGTEKGRLSVIDTDSNMNCYVRSVLFSAIS